jgi:hypothetical protein
MDPMIPRLRGRLMRQSLSSNEGAFRAPFDSCFHAGQFSDQLSSGGSKSSQSIACILESLLDRFRLGNELAVKGRRHDVPAFFGLLKSNNDLPLTHRALLHPDYGIRLWPSASMVRQKPSVTTARPYSGNRDRRTPIIAGFRQVGREKWIASSTSGGDGSDSPLAAGSSPAAGAKVESNGASAWIERGAGSVFRTIRSLGSTATGRSCALVDWQLPSV